MDSIKAIIHRPYDDSTDFWAACNERKFMIPKCQSCERLFYHPGLYCPHCGSSDISSQAASGFGKIYTFTHVHVNFGEFWASEIPYTSIIVTLDEGIRIPNRLVGPDREAVAIGDPVAIRWMTVEGTDQLLPLFERRQQV